MASPRVMGEMACSTASRASLLLRYTSSRSLDAWYDLDCVGVVEKCGKCGDGEIFEKWGEGWTHQLDEKLMA